MSDSLLVHKVTAIVFNNRKIRRIAPGFFCNRHAPREGRSQAHDISQTRENMHCGLRC